MSDIYNIAKTGLKTYKESLATTGQNIANVGNSSYSRRETTISEIKSGSPDVLQLSENISYGVKTDGVTRAFDQFIDRQLQTATSSYSYSEAQTEILNQLEKIVRPDVGSVSEKINEFFAEIGLIGQDPSSTASRYAAIDAAKGVVVSFKSAAQGINSLRQLSDERLKMAVADANAYLQQLLSIQKELLSNTSIERNDLLDQRDKLLGELSEVLEIKVNYKDHGEMEVVAGTDGQGRVILSGFERKYISVHNIENQNRILISSTAEELGTTVQISSGKVAGLLAAQYALGKTKGSLDALTRKFANEVNEIQKTGFDLNGDLGKSLFTLNSLEISKISRFDSSSQLHVSGISSKYINEDLLVSYVAEHDFWQISDTDGHILRQFKGATELDDFGLSISGDPSIGDKFQVKFTTGLAENLSLLQTDPSKIAASFVYQVESSIENNSNVKVKTEIVPEVTSSQRKPLNDLFLGSNNSSNPVTFTNPGILGELQNVDVLTDFMSLKQQPKLQISAPIDSLNENSKLSLILGNDSYVFDLSSHYSSIESFSDLAQLLNNGIIKSDAALEENRSSFSTLGLRAGGNATSLNISSAYLGDENHFYELTAGALDGLEGLLVPGVVEPAGLQIFTKEGVHLAGTMLSSEQIRSLVTVENGFNTNAKYSAQHLASDYQGNYANAQISRVSALGEHEISISSIGASSETDSNLKMGPMTEIPIARSIMSGPLQIVTVTGETISYTAQNGMMAGQIASDLNKQVSHVGVYARAHNLFELYSIPSTKVAFDLRGSNSTAFRIEADTSVDGVNGLVAQINKYSERTGIVASKSSSSGIVLNQEEGNDINIENVLIGNGGGIRVRQLDRYGEIIKSPQNSAPALLTTDMFALIGGQIGFVSTSEFDLVQNGTRLSSENQEFANGFIKRTYNLDQGTSHYTFESATIADQASNSVEKLKSIAPSSSYEIAIKGDNKNVELNAKISGASGDALNPQNLAKDIVISLRKLAPKTQFLGDQFNLSDGFPGNGDTIIFELGEQTYTATLNNLPEYVKKGDRYEINGTSYTEAEALRKLVTLAKFNVSGPELDRIRVGFSETADGFQIYAVANAGVVSGHALRLSSKTADQYRNSFHLTDASTAYIRGNDFDISQTQNSIVAELIVNGSQHKIRYNNGVLSFEDPTPDAGITLSLVPTSTNVGYLEIKVLNSVAKTDIRLKATGDSGDFGVNTASTQLTLVGDGFDMSEYGDDRIEVNAKVQSLAHEKISIQGLGGRDLVVLSTGKSIPIMLGSVKSKIPAEPSEKITARITSDDGYLVELLDANTGNYLATRTLDSSLSFQYNGIKWTLDGLANEGDEFSLLLDNNRRDDASNIIRLQNLATYSDITGKGGYAKSYSDLVTETGFISRDAAQRLDTSKAIYEVSLDRKSQFSGVDLDTEAARLLEQQQAYQAMAKVLSTAKELVETLLRSF